MHCFLKDAFGFKTISMSTFVLLLVILIPAVSDELYAAAELNLTFEALYEQQCAVCHGENCRERQWVCRLWAGIYCMARPLKR